MAGLGGSGTRRGTHRTPENRDVILRLLRSGATLNDAALFTKMDRDTLWRWMRADAEFSREVAEAEAIPRVRAAATVVDAAFGRPAMYDDAGRKIREEVLADPHLALTYLERRDPMNWGKRVTMDVRALVTEYAVREGFDPGEVIAEVEALMAENAASARRS